MDAETSGEEVAFLVLSQLPMNKIILIFVLTIFTTLCFAATKDDCTLSLDEAILLAVRSNPNVQTQRLTNITQKFSLFIEEWKFTPQYHLQSSLTAGRTASAGSPLTTTKGYKIQPSVTLLTPIGTVFSLESQNSFGEHFNPQLILNITQPLLRGFGRAVVEQALENARDDVYIQRLNTEGTLRTTVTAVINAYLDIVNGEKTIEIDRDAVLRAEKSVEQTKLFIKAGRKAGNELVTVEANVATAKSKLEDDKNTLEQGRYALLTAIGLDPNTNIRFANLNIDELIKKYELPSLEETKSLVLQNDITYQIEQLTLNGSKMRALLVAENHALPDLKLNINVSKGGGHGGGQNAGINSLFNNANRATGIGLNLDYTFNDQLAKQSILSNKIAIKQARIALKKSKWEKETSAINNWNTVLSAERSLRYAKDAEQLQQKTYHISYQKYLHGLVDSLELQTAQVQLINAEKSLLSARIQYLKALVTLDNAIGHTLRTWNIGVRN